MSETLNDLVKRCEEAQIQYTFFTSDAQGKTKEPTGLYITFPNGRNSCKLVIQNGRAAEMLLEVPFEKYQPLSGYKALWSPELGTIECELHHAASPDSDFYIFEFEDEVDGWELLEEARNEARPERLF
jgi:hypothetical protein